jgi:hypothetical protein
MRVIEEGQLKGAFRGFKDSGRIFEFRGGGKWKQAEYKYHYHYAYAPEAQVIEKSGGRYLVVDGVDEEVLVTKA